MTCKSCVRYPSSTSCSGLQGQQRSRASPVADAPTGMRTAFQPVLIAPALHLIQPQRSAYPLPKRTAARGDANGAQAQLWQGSKDRA